MSRVSQLELYNDKDVITQILLMKEQVETGTYKGVNVTDDGAGNLVFVFTDQNDDPTTFTIPVKLISTVTSSQSGSTVTMRITWTDGTHTDLSWTAGGDVTTNTNQTISAVKTFSASPIIPDTPSGIHAAVNLTYVSKTDGTNNLLHTAGVETINALKTVGAGGAIRYITDQVQNRLQLASASLDRDDLSGNFWVNILTYRDMNDNEVMSLRLEINNGAFILKAIFNDGTQHNVTIASWSP